GAMLGMHAGLAYYTIGPPTGLGIGGCDRAGPPSPGFVMATPPETQTLRVVPGREHPAPYSAALTTAPAHWIGARPQELQQGSAWHCSARLRHRQAEQACWVSEHSDGSLRVRFDAPQRAVAPGQYAVFYAGERCYGGAVIEHP